MKKSILFIILGMLITLSSCTKNFEDINTDPNNPDRAPVTNVFAYVIQNISSRFGQSEMQFAASYVGHVTNGTYTDVPTYQAAPSTIIWDGTFRTTMANLNGVIAIAIEEDNDNLLGASLVLKAYAMQMVVDAYGPAPFTEAGKATEGILNPKFDSEEFIYTSLLNELEQANDLLVDDEAFGIIGEGDLLYGGNIMNWKKFCNSLRLRLAIRISNVATSTAQTIISQILGDPDTYPIFESNSDNAQLSYPGGDWVEPWTDYFSSIGDNRIAKPIVDALLSYNDPRLEYYAEPISDGVSYIGLAVGEEADGEFSYVNDRFIKNPTGSVFFMKYAEVEFIKAEAFNRNLATGGANADRNAYEAGITTSCQEYGIGSGDINNYLAETEVAYTGDIEQIYTQKWISLFRQSWEAWAEMRRTDIPTLPPAANAYYGGHNRPPFRFAYPETEKNLNPENIPSSVNEVDGYWGYQIWWDTRTGVN